MAVSRSSAGAPGNGPSAISTGSAEEPLHDSGDTLRSGTSGGLFDVPDLEGVITRLQTTLDGINRLLGVGEGGGGAGPTDAADLAAVLESLRTALDEGAGVARTLVEAKTGAPAGSMLADIAATFGICS